MDTPRDFAEPRYKRWRLCVYRRDRFICKMCGSNENLEAHHIKRWADYPALRYKVNNGVTLCRMCHLSVTGNEICYESFFNNLISKPSKATSDNFLLIKRLMRGL